MTSHRRWGAAVGLALSALSMNACSLTGGPVEGVVLDKATNRPIADAIVVVRWHGHWTKVFGESSSACYHVESARTDANGRYSIPRWTRAPEVEDLRFSSGGHDVAIFKPGYVDLSGGEPGTVYMQPFAGSNDEYFRVVLDHRRWLCNAAGSSSNHVYRVFRAAAADAASRATTLQQRGFVSSLEHLARESLADTTKPTRYRGDTLVNVDPRDALKPEE